MKRTPTVAPALPAALRELFSKGQVYDSSCSREARVLYLDRDGGYYLKRAPAGSLRREWEMTSYFYSIGLSVEPLAYITEGEDYLLTRAAVAEDATDARYLSEPRRLAEWLGTTLRALHETPCDACPVPDRTADYLATVEEGARIGRFDPEFSPIAGVSPTAALAEVRAAAGAMTSRVLLHGDYCLPNVLLDGWRLSAFIDLGAAGRGDRHIDLFWGAWTLGFNLGTDAYRNRFFDAYGRADIDPAIIRAVGFAECFG